MFLGIKINFNRIALLCGVLGNFCFPTLVFADETTNSSGTTNSSNTVAFIPNCNLPLLPALQNIGVNFSGYVEGTYNYLSGNGLFTSGVPDRVFDTEQNGFTLQQVGITFAKQPDEGFGGLLNIIAGNDANVTASYPTNNDNNFDVVQAYLQYTVNNFTIMGGKFISLSGNEYIDPTLNNNFSQSILAAFQDGNAVFYLLQT